MSSNTIGAVIYLKNLLSQGAEAFKQLDLKACQINCWEMDLYSEENAQKAREAIQGIHIASFWAGWPPPKVWNFTDGPLTAGLVPKDYRSERMVALKKGADFAKALGAVDVTTHVGFIPENPNTTEYRELVVAVREVAAYCKALGLFFNFETGQETPITLIRIIEDIGLDNVGINLDPANLLMYGKGNPVDAVDIYKGLIRGVHIKDGVYPANGYELGKEMPVGEGKVNFPLLLEKLQEHRYQGDLIIEKEVTGAAQRETIIKTKALLESLLKGDSV